MDVFAAELYEVLPRAIWSRRGFLVTTLATGFAAAAGPISAETITTDTIGLDVAEVKVPTADGEMPAYRAMPATGGPFATILIVQEIFGVHEHIKDICRRIAKAGYFAIAPELYARQGNPSTYLDIPKLVADVV
jgi:carboxymethylenebutenolidase